MSRIEIAPEVLDDLDRFVVHMAGFGVEDVSQRVEDLISAIQVLAHSPNVGRRANGGTRELVIGTGSHGYVALYRYVELIDTVFILAVRGRRESGYKRRKR